MPGHRVVALSQSQTGLVADGGLEEQMHQDASTTGTAMECAGLSKHAHACECRSGLLGLCGSPRVDGGDAGLGMWNLEKGLKRR